MVTEQVSTIPKAFFELQQLFLRATHYDQQHQLDKALPEYFRVAKVCENLLQHFPDVPLKTSWDEIGRLSAYRASQLQTVEPVKTVVQEDAV
ncbi:MAG: hypothetical protein ACFE9L_12445 [Candidatus Hodarchaeota archaeon]